MEKAVDQASLIDTKIPQWFATKDWNYILTNLGDAYENMVKEFYANAILKGMSSNVRLEERASQ